MRPTRGRCRRGNFWRRWLAAALLAYACAAWVTPTRAAASAPVTVAGRVVFRIAGEAQEAADQLAQVVQARIDDLLNKGRAAADLRSGKVGGQFVVLWNDQVIVTVDAYQAARANAPAKDVAARWAAALKDAVARPLFGLSRTSVELPVGGGATLTLTGPLTTEVSMNGYDLSVAEVAVDSAAGTVHVTGVKPGHTKLLLERSGRQAVLQIVVKDWAATFPDRIEAKVTGDPVPPEIMVAAALHAAESSVQLAPGAQLFLKDDVQVPASLPPGASAVAQVPLIITADGYFPLDRTMNVTLTNAPFPPRDGTLLFVSNRPEGISAPGVIFTDTFTAAEPMRLLYSHKNITRQMREVLVVVSNPTDQPVEVSIASSQSGPAPNELYVGHMAAVRFLQYLRQRAGYLMTIPAHHDFTLIHATLHPGDLLSGLAQCTILSGDRLTVTVLTAREWPITAPLPLLNEPFNPFRIHPHGTFDQALIEQRATYEVGKGEVAVEYGKGPWRIDRRSGEPNTGNFGVLYRFDITLKNPTAAPAQVGFYFSPVNGVARGSFIIDGQLKDTELARPPNDLLVTTCRLAPGEVRNMQVLTLPEAGSYYPARIVMKPVESAL